MDASRSKTKDVLSALSRREKVNILNHGKIKGTKIPVFSKKNMDIISHPYFGSKLGDSTTVMEEMATIRGKRYKVFRPASNE